MVQNPTLKLAIKRNIETYLYKEPLAKLRAELELLITSNDALSNTCTYLFTYRGKRYKWYDTVPLKYGTPLLHPSLHERMDAYIQSMKYLTDYEVPLTMGYVQNVLNTSDRVHDYLHLLPSALHPAIESLAKEVCGSKVLTFDDAEKMVKTHEKSIDLIKERLMLNLLFKE